MDIRLMKDSSFQEILVAWNDGFQDYPVELAMNMEQLLRTMAAKHLSPQYSFVAYEQGDPVGLILNSVEEVDGKKVAYNGGTAVHPDYRKRGLGHELVQATMAMCNKEMVEEATLEAIFDNTSAIRLYEKHGYEIIDRLKTCALDLKEIERKSVLSIRQISVSEWGALTKRRMNWPWQNRVSCITQSEIYLFSDEQQPYGFVVLTKKGHRITIFQLETLMPQVDLYEEMLVCLARHFPNDHVVVFNIPHKHPAKATYEKWGFQTVIEQVWMKRTF